MVGTLRRPSLTSRTSSSASTSSSISTSENGTPRSRRNCLAWWPAPHAIKIQCCRARRNCARPFPGPAHPEPPHPPLFLQHTEDRLGQCFSSPIDRSSRRGAQFPSHAPMRRMAGVLLQPSAPIQDPRQVVVWHVGIDGSPFHGLQVLQREKTAIRTHLFWPFRTFPFHLVHHRHHQTVSPPPLPPLLAPT